MNLELTQLLRKMKDNSLEPSGQFPILFQTEFDIINTSSLFMKPNPQKNVEIERKYWSKQENVSVRGSGAVAWHRSTLTDYGLTFGVRASEMSDGL